MSAISIEITKGKMLKDGKVVEIEFTKRSSDESKPAKCSEEHTDLPHDDLKRAFAALAPHAAICGGFISSAKLKSIEKMSAEDVASFSVTGCTVVGDNEGVIISAHKSHNLGSTGFNTPIIRFNAEGEKAYAFAEELELAVSKWKEEMNLYLGGKFWEDPQMKLELN